MKKSNLCFDRIVGQARIIERLATQLSEARPHQHAFLLTGPTGIGKRTLAFAFAAALLCADRQGRERNYSACGLCPSCRYLLNSAHPDFKWLSKGEERLLKVERVRREIVADLQLKPQFGELKVYLIEAEDLNEQGQNILLKSLEEPPEYAVFILTCDRAERLLDTIRSRVVEVQLKRRTAAEMDCLMGAGELPPNWDFAKRYAEGIPGVALDLCASDWFNELRSQTCQIFFNAATASRTEMLNPVYKQIDGQKEYLAIMLDLWQSLIRDVLILLRGEDPVLNNPDYVSQMEDLLRNYRFPTGEAGEEARLLKLNELLRLSAAIDELRRAMQVNASFEGMAGQFLLSMRGALQANPA